MSNKDKKQYIILGCLVLAFIFVLAKQMSTRPSKKNPKISTASVIKPVAKKEEMKQSNQFFKELQSQASSIAMKRDPFSAIAVVEHKGPYLNGIAHIDGEPAAIISGEVYRAGDNFEGKTIVEIQRNRVIFTDGTVESELILEK